MIDLSIVILNYNARDFLREVLKSIQKNVSKKISYEVIVVDNASSDNSEEMVEKEFPEFTSIANKDNRGFSAGNNIGVKKTKGRYVLFLNPDTIVHKDTLETMVTFMDEHKDAGAATCRLDVPHEGIDDASHRGFPTPWNALCHFSGLAKIFPSSEFFNGYHLGWKDLKKIHEIDALAGAFMIVRREAGEKVKWWDEDYFFYGEDIDFCYMLKKNGWKIYYVPTVSIIHYKGVSSGIKQHSQNRSTANKETKIRSTKWRFEAMKIFYRKHYVDTYPRFLTALVMLAVDLKLFWTIRRI